MTKPVVTAYDWSPDRGRGYVRDMRVRWALEEVGQAYDVRYLSWGQQKEAAHCARHPFGQVPTYEEDGLVLFESGAIVLHIAETHRGLFPEDSAGRARAIGWMFAALNTVEPVIRDHFFAAVFEADKAWSKGRLPGVEARLRERLDELSARLGDAEWLDGAFSAGDLLMVAVLRPLSASRIIEAYLNLSGYVARGEARPAFARARNAKGGADGRPPGRLAAMTTRREHMIYVDGFVVPVPAANKDAYREMAAKAAPVFREYGATRVVESWGDDVPEGKVTDFRRAVQAAEGETVVFSWIEWPSKEARDAAWPKLMEDERMKPDFANMPFDGKRMIYGSFAAILEG